MSEKLHNILKILSGVLILLVSSFLLLILFFEPDSLAVFFNFSLDISAENLGEAIGLAVAGLIAGLFFALFVFIFGIIYLAFFVTIGSLNLALRRSKVLSIITIIIIGITIFLDIRSLVILIIANIQSIILPIFVSLNIVIFLITLYSIIFLFRQSKSN